MNKILKNALKEKNKLANVANRIVKENCEKKEIELGFKNSQSILPKNQIDNKIGFFQHNIHDKNLSFDYLLMVDHKSYLKFHERHAFLSFEQCNHMHNGKINSSTK